jgi:hypothetical protein
MVIRKAMGCKKLAVFFEKAYELRSFHAKAAQLLELVRMKHARQPRPFSPSSQSAAPVHLSVRAPRTVRIRRSAAALALSMLPLAAAASNWSQAGWGASFAEPRTTSLVEFRQGSDLSGKVRAIKGQGFETAAGNPIDFTSWYATKWTDVRLSWLTQVSKTTGLIWGFNTGERGEKYTISPGIKIGFIHQARFSPRTVLTFRATATLGTRLREKTCTADYGEIGGVQSVNCRLAASQIEPQETLGFLFNEPSRDQRQISLAFNHAF